MAGTRISRRKLSAFLAEKIASDTPVQDVITQAAAYLIETKQTHDVELLVRDIEEELAVRGIAVADVASAHSLTDEARSAIADLLGTKDVRFRETVDPSLLGGIRIDVPGKRYDGTLRRKINLLKSLDQ